MPRIRTVKPGYPKHRKVRSVSRDARLLNIHLWNLADDEGRLHALPLSIIGEVFPEDDDVTPVVLREWLCELERAGLIHQYEVDGDPYIQCHDFHEHQVINKPTKSVLPPIPEPHPDCSGSTPVVLPEPDGRATVPEVGSGSRKKEGEEANASSSSDFEDWLAHYRRTTGRDQVKGSKAARSAFAARKRDGLSLDDLKLATVGCHGDEWCVDRGFDVPETILRASNVQRYIALASKPANGNGNGNGRHDAELERTRRQLAEAEA